MKLSDRERKILACVQLQADASMHEIRRRTGLRDHTIRNALASLEDRGIIRERTIVNLSRLGYLDIYLLFSLATDNKRTAGKILTAIAGIESVSFVGQLGGDLDYMALFHVRHPADIDSELAKVAKVHGPLFEKKEVMPRISWTFFRRKYLHPAKQSVESFTIGPEKASPPLDELDHKLLVRLTQPETARSQIARDLRVASTTIQYRMRRLVERRIITASIFTIDMTQLGMHRYRLLLTMKSNPPVIAKKLRDVCAVHPHIIGLRHCLGRWDYDIAIEMDRSKRLLEVRKTVESEIAEFIASSRVESHFDDLKWKPYPFERWPLP